MQKRLKVLLSGSSGFVGMSLSRVLSDQGHTVIPLIRGAARPEAILWDFYQKQIHLETLKGIDVVIHLSGEPLIGRWTDRKRQEILRSRIESTRFLAEAISKISPAPSLFFTASAIGAYGDRGEEVLTEESSMGQNFVASVCRQWEGATEVLERRGVRVVHGRFGVILGSKGGLLKKVLPLYRLGLGGNLGNGQQWLSWVSLRDLMRMILHVIETESLVGPVNCVAPQPVRQEEFSNILAHQLHRPSWFTQPDWLLRLIFSQMADEVLLASIRAIPEKLLKTHFSFLDSVCSEAIHWVLDEE